MLAIALFDKTVLHFLKKYSEPLARISLFIIFFWFGILKLFFASPANTMIIDLLEHTLPFITFPQFIFLFGIYEMIIGVLFLFRGMERFAIALLIPHMITTLLPLILLSEITWQVPFVPTMEGQYIIKNLALIALAFSVAVNLHPLSLDKNAQK